MGVKGRVWRRFVVVGRSGGVGWIMDFADIKKAVASVLDLLDHRYLNEVEGLENPTSEVLARWIWNRVKPGLPALSKIEIEETCTSGCTYAGE